MGILNYRGKHPARRVGPPGPEEGSSGIIQRYFKDPEPTKEVYFPNNWYDTKDLAYMDEEGYFWYGSRSDDIMTSHGYRISPAHVETALQEYKAVLESGRRFLIRRWEKR